MHPPPPKPYTTGRDRTLRSLGIGRGSGAHGVPADIELWAPLARAVFPGRGPGAVRALLRRRHTHGHRPRGRLVLQAGPTGHGASLLGLPTETRLLGHRGADGVLGV